MSIKTEDYVREMRKGLCPGEVCDDAGNLNHKYFLSKKNKYWGDAQHKALADGLARFEVGEWQKFKKSPALENFHDIELELRTCILLNVKSIATFKGRKLTDDEFKLANISRN